MAGVIDPAQLHKEVLQSTAPGRDPRLNAIFKDIECVAAESQVELRRLMRSVFALAAAEETRRKIGRNQDNGRPTLAMLALIRVFELMRPDPDYAEFRKERQGVFYRALQQDQHVRSALRHWVPNKKWRQHVLKHMFAIQAEVFSHSTLEIHPPKKFIFEWRAEKFGSQRAGEVFINTSRKFGWNKFLEPPQTVVHEGDHWMAEQMALAARDGCLPSHSPFARQAEIFMDFFGFTKDVPRVYVEKKWNSNAYEKHPLERLGFDAERVIPRLIVWYTEMFPRRSWLGIREPPAQIHG